MNNEYKAQPWMHRVLLAAGVYNLIWGAVAVLSPEWMLRVLGVEPASIAPQLWQCIGMIVGVYGVGYLLASRHPFHHWVITLVGLLGKVLGPIGFVASVSNGSLPGSMGWTILTNDVIWWIPFAMILWGALRFHHVTGSAYEIPEADDPLREIKSNTGDLLNDLASSTPQLVLFLRHAGCTFCREALSDLSKQRSKIEESGCGIAIVHLGPDSEENDKFFEQYGLGDLPRFSDPQSRLYRQFGLDLGGFSQLFGLRVWIRALIAGVLNGHGIGAAQGNSFQMPGIYLFHKNQILGGFRHNTASDRPDYLALARQVPKNEAVAVPV